MTVPPTLRPVHSSGLGSLAALVLTASLLLSGCSFRSTYRPEPAVLQDDVNCSAGVDRTTGSVPDDFVAVDVVRCVRELPEVSLDPTAAPQALFKEEHLSGDYTALLAALAEPSERGGTGNCLDYADVPPEVWLVNAAGKAVDVAWPVDHCDHLKPATALALNALTVTKTVPVPVTPTATPTAKESSQ